MKLELAQLQWGWITPGTSVAHRHAQDDAYLDFLAEPILERTRHFLLTHCGWWLDGDATDWVLALTTANPEPGRNACPGSVATLAALRQYVEAGRLEFVIYPYAACVAEATSGEGLLRSFRASAELAQRRFGVTPRMALNHDFCYNLIWGTPQMPRLATLLGIDCLGGQLDAVAVGPDGSAIRVVGDTVFHDRMLEGDFDTDRAWFVPYELHTSIELHHALNAGRHVDALRNAVALGLDDYLARRPDAPRVESRLMGTKGWYGGCIDSLLLEQAVKSVELRLPAVEALAGQLPLADREAIERRLADLWKATWILMDNHILWQCHDYRLHYLPEAIRLRQRVTALEAELLHAGEAVVFNTVSWPRDLVVSRGENDILIRRVPGWGSRAIADGLECPPVEDDPLTLRNERLCCRFDERGEILSCDIDGLPVPVAGTGRLMRLHESPLECRLDLAAGESLADFEGSLVATMDLEVPPGHDALWLSIAKMEGSAALIQALPLDGADDFPEEKSWYALQSLHWGGGGLPRATAAIERLRVITAGARRLRVRIWLLTQGSAMLSDLRAEDEAGRELAVGRLWHLRLLYRVARTMATPTGYTVVRRTAALQTLRFTGEMPDLTYELEVSLRAGAAAVEYSARFHFPEPVRLGLSSPPFDPADGSLLGAQCERPYIPGLVVMAPVGPGATYVADKPYYLQEMLTDHQPSWHTDRRDWWLGFSPFIGMNLAVAGDRQRRMGLFTRGLKHFFRWRHGGEEWLGLSLGASIIHPMTQGHSVRPGTPAASLARRTDHDPYVDTSFLHAHGSYDFHWAWRPVEEDAAIVQLWKEAQAFALPPITGHGPILDGVEISPEEVVLTAMEPTSLRLCNLGDRPVEARLRLPGGTEPRLPMAPHAIAELELPPPP